MENCNIFYSHKNGKTRLIKPKGETARFCEGCIGKEVRLGRRTELLRSVHAGQSSALATSKIAKLLQVSRKSVYQKTREPDEQGLAAKPLILNSDQGSQFASEQYIREIEKNRVRINMDGIGRWADNIPIERWFRTLEYEEVYLKDYENIREARKEIGRFIHDYNFVRLHSAIDNTPAYPYFPQQLYDLLTATPAATPDKSA